jgi:poly(3-hydroxyalkanoate) synthetase
MTAQKFNNSEVVLNTDVYSLHFFNHGEGTPVFIIPPHAGRHGNIAQKMIDMCVNQDKTVFAFELKSATQATKNTSIINLIEALTECQNFIGKKVDIIGLCQGGWVSAIYTALYQERIERFAAFATPINTKTGKKNAIEDYVSSNSFIIAYHKKIVEMHNGIQPGYMQWLAFSMVRPEYVYMERWMRLQQLMLSCDYNGLKKWKKNNDWYDEPQDLAGVWFLQAFKNLFYNNDLYEGRWKVCNKIVNLNNITCPCFLYAGEDDDITHPQQMFDMKNKIGTTNVKCTCFPGAGHTKVFVGASELKQFKKDFFGE